MEMLLRLLQTRAGIYFSPKPHKAGELETAPHHSHFPTCLHLPASPGTTAHSVSSWCPAKNWGREAEARAGREGQVVSRAVLLNPQGLLASVAEICLISVSPPIIKLDSPPIIKNFWWELSPCPAPANFPVTHNRTQSSQAFP